MKLIVFVGVMLGVLGTGYTQDEGSGTKPLTRCHHDMMCKVFCAFGTKLGEDGCPTCECNPNPCELMECDDGQTCVTRGTKAYCVMDCPMMKCIPCESGRYFRDQHNCQTCDCIPGPPQPVIDPIEPCPMPMCMSECPNGYKTTPGGCQTCDCEDMPLSHDPPPRVRACPAVMCAMFCENGFLQDERGCDMCQCREIDECEMVRCAAFSVCRKGQCQIPGLCDLRKEMGPGDMAAIKDLLGADFDVDEVLGCTPDGTFSPHQCTDDRTRCWCVDDRGVAVPGTEYIPMEGDDGGDMCSPRMTRMMKLAFQLEHDLEEEGLPYAIVDIERQVKQTVAGWLGVNPDLIFHVQIVVAGRGLLSVEVDVMSDGETDLPSVAHNMNRNIQSGSCQLSYGDHTISTKQGSLHTQHTYDDGPATDPTVASRCYRVFRIALYPVIGFLLLVLLLVGIACVIRTRKRSASYQFAHKKIENMDNFKKVT